MAETVQLPLTGAGQAQADVAVDLTGDGVVQLFKLAYSADGSAILVPADVDGLFVQSMQRAESPQDDLLFSADLAAGSSAELNAAVITSGKLGRLMAATVGCSVACRTDIQVVTGARTTRDYIYTAPGESKVWTPPAPTFIEQAGGGTNRFGVAITNLDVSQAADVRATLYWDEVNP